MNLHIASDFELPLDAVTETIAILAKRGAGKTYTAAVVTEELLKAGQQVVVCDPIGVWWGLRAAANGKDAGLPIVVLGGERGDIPLAEHAGEVVAAAIVENGFSAVLDLSLFRKGQVIRFMTSFAEAIYRLNRNPLHIVLDEADTFAPQRPFKDEARMLGALENVARRGRARGLGLTMITQRSAVLNKNLLTQIETLVCLRMLSPQDKEAVDAWVNEQGNKDPQAKKKRDDMMASLSSLDVGTAWFWSPAWLNCFRLVKIRQRETFDSSATPKVGEKRIEPKKLAAVDLAKLGSQIQATAQKAKENDPAELKREIAALKKELSKTAVVLPAKVEIKEVPVFNSQDFEAWNSLARAAEQNLTAIAEQARTMQSVIHEFTDRLSAAAQARLAVPSVKQPVCNPPARPAVVRQDTEAADPDARPSGGLKRMLVALAQCPDGLSAKQLGVRADLSSASGTFGTYLGKARSNGWIDGDRDHLQITQAGLDALGHYELLPTGEGLLHYWLNELGASSGAARILAALAEHYPASLSDEQVGELAHLAPTSGTFADYLRRMRTLELVHGERSALRASDDLFDGR